MSRRVSVSIALAITIIAMTLTFAITWIVSMRVFDNTMSAVTRLQAEYQKLYEIDTYVRGNYYGEIDDTYLFDRMAVGYMSGLGDRYSVYYTEKEYTDYLAVENGTRVGIGLETVRDADGSHRIVRVYKDSPADRAGLEAGGRILSVDGVEAKNYTSAQALQAALLGTESTEVVLVCQYNLTDEETFTVRRVQNYAPPTVELQMVDGYAYVRISSFTAKTQTEFATVQRQLLNNDAKGILLDVRAAGGQFAYAYDMIDALCPRGTIAKRINRTGAVRVEATSDDNAVDLPMVVLVNENTSAAAELFAASIRDLAGGQVAGCRTMGRGTVQNAPQRLADGSAIAVTTAVLTTGQDENFNGVGIIPSVELDAEGVLPESLITPNVSTDPQILRGLELVRAIVREAGEEPPVSSSESTSASDSASVSADTSTSLPENDSSVAPDESVPEDDSTADESTPEDDSSTAADDADSSSNAKK